MDIDSSFFFFVKKKKKVLVFVGFDLIRNLLKVVGIKSARLRQSINLPQIFFFGGIVSVC